MYFIKKITVENDKYILSEIINHTKTISNALALLEKNVKDHIKEECGKQIATDCKIIDILNVSQIYEPTIDTMLVYRIGSDSNRLHVYQRKTSLVAGYFVNGLVSDFRKTQIFEIEEYTLGASESTQSTQSAQSSLSTIPEMVAVGPAGIKIPIQMTLVPIAGLIDELKKSKRFLDRLQSTD